MIDTALKNPSDCTGCSACASVCPQACVVLSRDAEYFLYPAVDYGRCIGCGLCIQVCPSLHGVSAEIQPAAAYACICSDESIRAESSSGGVFSLLSRHVLQSPDGGIVFGAKFDENFRVVHGMAETEEEAGAFRGSKYVQSEIGDSFKQVRSALERGRSVLFSGTPCQIAGLKAYLGKDYDCLLCVDLICHGVPSPGLWEKYLLHRTRCAGAQPSRVFFRSKNESWKVFSLSFRFENGMEYSQNIRKDPYMTAFLSNISLRPSCYACPYRNLNRQSDLTLADFWGIQHIFPDMDDDKGTSLVLVNSAKGKAAFDVVSADMKCRQTDLREAVLYNLSAVRNIPLPARRAAFFASMEQSEFDALVGQFCADGFARKTAKRILRRLGPPGFVVKLHARLSLLFRQ
jgi:coenzyme F420-reducing hydrogenase beta subunit